MQFREAYPGPDQNQSTGESRTNGSPGFEPRKYLRFWGTDYPYLYADGGNCPSCLPVPADSNCQRVVDAYHRLSGLSGFGTPWTTTDPADSGQQPWRAAALPRPGRGMG